ncbi:hypothetical protein XH84_09785 [Bradyrhizobium nanningense]|uniref:lysine N(6)-hydroxylase/L-ornithine N(5)-oxygenase family protein n=1 Tax=Bradyrhizobium nanningense TaxID=1325118 RepID=UPI0010092F5B|nr:SidA/IucD/PvdA family monooxygenase [Bradyrhizobium nanningense]RXH33558.1 hypothetical protein XH84_09785 [Bradyrhizobium nanningense]
MYDVVGIGIGPFNLSLAALVKPTGLRCVFFEDKPGFSWHAGMAFSSARLQVSHLKDCVSLVDPTSPFSFLNFLLQTGRLHAFVNRRSGGVSRNEFGQYYAWVADQLPYLRFGQKVLDVCSETTHFRVLTSQTECRAQHVVLGLGICPDVPDCARPLLGERVYHVAEYLNRPPLAAGERVLLVGAGQSGSEVMEQLLSGPPLKQILWVTLYDNLEPMDDCAFTNEFYTPAYLRHFQTKALSRRREWVQAKRLSSDGVSRDLANQLFSQIYEHRFVENKNAGVQLVVSARLDSLRQNDAAFEAVLKCTETAVTRRVAVDRVILATGFVSNTAPFLDRIMQLACTENGLPKIRADCSLESRIALPGKIYLQNRTRIQHGLQNPNLSLVAYRNATIINSIMGKEFYPLNSNRSMLSRVTELREDR